MASTHHGSTPSLPHSAPQQFTMSSGVKSFIWAACFLGVLALGAGLAMDKLRTLHAFVTALFYFTSLALGGLFFTALQHVVKAGWNVTTRRVSESFTAFLPWAAGLGLLFAFAGAPHLYAWLNPDYIASNELLQKKVSYLNEGFFKIRLVVFYIIWGLFAWKLVGNSLKQDLDGNEKWTHSSLKWSVLFLILFALSYSLFSVDMIMSIDPNWFSTMFGVYCFAGLFQSTMAFMILIVIHLMKRGLVAGFVNENHLHDYGKFLFAFTIFYAYIAFSQFMLIWYANLPEETLFYVHRSHGTWMAVSYSLIVFKFLLPFLLLLPRGAKRNMANLTRVSILVLIMQYVDVYWLVYPNLNRDVPLFSFVEIGVFLGILGIFMYAVARHLGKHSLVPMKDPRLHESLQHHI